MANENCLAGLRCPKCGSYGPFGIAITTWAANVTDEGFSDVGDAEWDRDSIIRCETCNEVATVADFDEGRYGNARGRNGSKTKAIAENSAESEK